MNRLIIIVFIVGLSACNPKNTRDNALATESEIDSTLATSDTVTILGEQYRGFGRTPSGLFIVNSKGDTVINQPDVYFDFEFIDFNGDSLKDIVVHRMSNVPAIQDLFLFDKTKTTLSWSADLTNSPIPNR